MGMGPWEWDKNRANRGNGNGKRPGWEFAFSWEIIPINPIIPSVRHTLALSGDVVSTRDDHGNGIPIDNGNRIPIDNGNPMVMGQHRANRRNGNGNGKNGWEWE